MVQLKQEELIKSRGYRATIKAAYNLFTENYKVILKHIWPYALVLAAITGIFVLNQFRVYGQTSLSLVNILTGLALMVLVFAADMAFTGRLMTLVNQQSLSWNILRALKASLWFLLLIVIISIIVSLVGVAINHCTAPGDATAGIPQTDPIILMQQQQMAYLKTMGIMTLVGIVFGLLLLPIVYIIMQYFVETDTRFHQIFFKGWKTGMKHWGYLFITLLVVGILLSVVITIISLPLIILFTAYGISLQGVLQGDEAGLPGYFHILAYGVSVVVYFVYYIMTIFALFVAYYIYGSIKAKEQEKDQFIKVES